MAGPCVKKISKTGRVVSRFEMARTIARLSNHPAHKHGAVLVKGGNILSVACNMADFSKHAGLYKPFTDYTLGSLHAEIAALRGRSKDATRGAIMYVVRLGGHGLVDLALSAPCVMCQKAMKAAGIKRVIYSIDNNNIESMTL